MPSTKLDAVRRQLLSATIQETIVNLIAKDGLGPGDPLPTETRLAEELEVSRNSVREAVKALQAIGIVEARVGAGLYVGEFSLASFLDIAPLNLVRGIKDLRDALVTRRYLETGMVSVLLEMSNPDQLEHLRSILTQWKAEAERGSIAPDLDRAFHQVLTSPAENRVVSKVLDLFWQVRRLAEERGELPETKPLKNYRRHARIFDALGKGDAEQLREAISQHYDEVLAEMA